MTYYILRRTGQLALTAFLVASATFLLSALIPGDFFTRQLVDPTVHVETIRNLRQQYGLDEPLHVQYVRWLGNAMHLDLGYSLSYRRPVASVIIDAIAKTLWIGAPALILGLLAGILLGTFHGIRSDGPTRLILDVLSTVALALPTIVLGLAALLIASRTHWFPLGGMSSASAQELAAWDWLLDRAHHLALPVVCLAIPLAASIERIQSAATRSALGESWVCSARARGVGPRALFFRHVLRPSINSVISVSAPLLAGVLSGSLVLEIVFSWPGLGRAMYDAVLNDDLHLLVGGASASTVLLVAANTAADLLLLALDPRTRIAQQGGAR